MIGGAFPAAEACLVSVFIVNVLAQIMGRVHLHKNKRATVLSVICLVSHDTWLEPHKLPSCLSRHHR